MSGPGRITDIEWVNSGPRGVISVGRVSGNSHCWDVDQVITVKRLGCESGRGGAWQGRVTTGAFARAFGGDC